MHKYFTENIASCPVVLCLNGELPPLSFFLSLDIHKSIIAADGAVNSLLDMGLVPDAVVGDLDSFDEVLFGRFCDVLGKKSSIVRILEQDYCDFEKAVYYIFHHVLDDEKISDDICKKNAKNNKKIKLFNNNILLLGVSGGNIDHIINNFNVILRFCSGYEIFNTFIQTNFIFYAPPIWGFLIKPGQKKTFPFGSGTKVSFFGFSGSRVKTRGLKWELEGQVLDFPGSNSAFNRVADPFSFVVEVSSNDDGGGANGVIVMIYENEVIDQGIGP